MGGVLTVQRDQIFTLVLRVNDFNITTLEKGQLFLGNTTNPNYLVVHKKEVVHSEGGDSYLKVTIVASQVSSIKLTQLSIGSEVYGIGEITLNVVERFQYIDISSIEMGAYCDAFVPALEPEYHINVPPDQVLKKIVYNLSVTEDLKISAFWGVDNVYSNNIYLTVVKTKDENGSMISHHTYKGYYTSLNCTLLKNKMYEITYILTDQFDHYLLQPYIRLDDKRFQESIGYVFQI